MHGGAAIVCMCSGVEGAASGLHALAATLNEAAFLVVHECRLVYLDADMILLKHTGGLGTGMEGRAGGRAGERAGGGGVGTHILITFFSMAARLARHPAHTSAHLASLHPNSTALLSCWLSAPCSPADHLFELPPGFYAVGDCYGGREFGEPCRLDAQDVHHRG